MECVQMRDFSEFCEQLNEMRVRFHKWDNCERTVALYYLMVGLPFPNARFLQNALEHCIASVSTPTAQELEKNANDANYISKVLTERPQSLVNFLLIHLPLLKPGNKDAADMYLACIRRVLQEYLTPFKIYNECVEVMSYVFVHPAFDKEEKQTFKQLLKQVVNRVTPDAFVHSPVNESSDESVSPKSELLSAKPNLQTKLRSNSLTPQTGSQENLVKTQDIWSSQENLDHPLPKPRSYSLSNDKSLVNLSMTLQSSSSETRLQELQTMADMPIAKSIMAWLKSLRLHKYGWVFNNLTYEQMLNLTEESLQAIGITKGARHKLLLSIGKLKERSQLLTELETEVMNGGDLLNALKKLKAVLQSPLQVSIGEDLPLLFVKVMGKVCTQLLMLRKPSDECLVMFATLCERAENSEAFTGEQRKRLNLWKEQIIRENNIPAYIYKQNSLSYNRTQVTKQQQQQKAPYHAFHAVNDCAQKSSSYPNMQHAQPSEKHRHSVGSVHLRRHLQGMQGYNLEQQSSGPRLNQFHVRFQESEVKDVKRQKSVDIESSLESLCLQMMEHALGP